MGKLTCTVMTGFLALNMAVVLLIVATATPAWLQARYNGTGIGVDKELHVNITMGLWRICHDDKCVRLNETIQEDWFRSVQGLDVIGVGLATFALLLTYAILLLELLKHSGVAAIFNTTLQSLSAVSSLTALIIFAVRGKQSGLSEEIPDNYIIKFDYSFDVDIVGVICNIIAAVASVQSAYYYSNHQKGYENI